MDLSFPREKLFYADKRVGRWDGLSIAWEPFLFQNVSDIDECHLAFFWFLLPSYAFFRRSEPRHRPALADAVLMRNPLLHDHPHRRHPMVSPLLSRHAYMHHAERTYNAIIKIPRPRFLICMDPQEHLVKQPHELQSQRFPHPH